MLRDQRRYKRPRRQRVERLDETCAEQGPSAVTLPATLVPVLIQLRDERGEFGRIEEGRYVRDDRASRYFPTAKGATTPLVTPPEVPASRGLFLRDLQDLFSQGHRTEPRFWRGFGRLT
jgi:hypothetical protein